MSLTAYTRAAGFTIAYTYTPEVSDSDDGDLLYIDIVSPTSVRFRYAPVAPSASRLSWNGAVGTYYAKQDIITGEIDVIPVGGGVPVRAWYSIALDRTLPQPANRPTIHVFVKLQIPTAPDEGSYTGQGN
jgi:hypothetical protein